MSPCTIRMKLRQLTKTLNVELLGSQGQGVETVRILRRTTNELQKQWHRLLKPFKRQVGRSEEKDWLRITRIQGMRFLQGRNSVFKRAVAEQSHPQSEICTEQFRL